MGYEVAPATLEQVRGKLQGASGAIEDGAAEPPMPQAGAVTGLVGSYLAQLCEAIGNISSGAAGMADAVAQGKQMYVDHDHEQAAGMAAAKLPQ